MKRFKSIAAALFTISLSMGASAGTPEAPLDPYVEQALIQVCKVAKSDRLFNYRKKMREHHLKEATVASKVMCNGDDISDFARKHGAYKVASRLEKSLESNVSITDLAAITKINVTFDE